MSQYVCVVTEPDGSQSAWGPFSEARAATAVAAFEAAGADNARALILHSSAVLTEELPDWRRVA